MNAGHDPKHLKPTFSEGAKSLEQKLQRSNKHEESNKPPSKQSSTLSPHQTLYYHPTFHPKDVSRIKSKQHFNPPVGQH